MVLRYWADLPVAEVATALGAGYQDVADVFDAAGAVRTPTFFSATTLFRDDTSLVTDRRVRTLYPPWEYASLQAAVTAAQTTDQTALEQNLARQVAQIAVMIRAGGTFAPLSTFCRALSIFPGPVM